MPSNNAPLAGGNTLVQQSVIDPKTGTMRWAFLQWFQDANNRIQNGLNQIGQLIGEINASTQISGRGGTIGTALQNVSSVGVVQPEGITPASDAAQGGVVLPNGAGGNVLGSAALAETSEFDAAGAAAAAQANAETFATTAANAAQSNAETFAANGSNISSGTVAAARLPTLSALSGQITDAQLPAAVPVVSFGSGAPSGASTEGFIYFNTAATPYVGYVYHSGAWAQF